MGEYYRLWWTITSGGPRLGYMYPTAIVEVNAGTGENYVEETGETIHGSAGHALQMKLGNPNAHQLTLILLEQDGSCYSHLKNVILRMSPEFPLTESEDLNNRNLAGVYLLNRSLKQSIDFLRQTRFANSLFFFDPLLYTPWTDIDQVAQGRISRYYQTGTEFIVFIFTSDWFQGRKDSLAPLPTDLASSDWTVQEQETVQKMDDLFGHQEWRAEILHSSPILERQEKLTELYRKRLHKWFRYVLPLPFEPKPGQNYHLFMCSNYEAGVRITRDYYSKSTGNPMYSPDNRVYYSKFSVLHPELLTSGHSNRPDHWKILWRVLREHEEGICDEQCLDLVSIQPNPFLRRNAIKWLESKGYFREPKGVKHGWPNSPTLYQVDWQRLRESLGIQPPMHLEPLRPRKS